jgi:amino acid transporter
LANDFSIGEFVPSFGDALVFAPAIVYNLLGFELISSIAGNLDNPGKNIPKMTVLSGILIAGLYIFGTFGILAATPAESLDTVDGFFYTLQELTTVFGGASEVIFKILIALALFTLMANMISWTLGGVEVLDSSDLKKKSKLLAHRHKKYDTPDYSYVLMGVISTILIVFNFSLDGDANDVFWTILSFSFVVFLLPYLWLFPAFVKLRLTDTETKRPYLVPGGKAGMWISAALGEFFIGLSLILLFTEGDALYYSVLVVGTLLTAAYGLYLYFRGEKVA